MPTPSAPRTPRCTPSWPARRASVSADATRPRGWRRSKPAFDDIREAHAAAVEVGDIDRALRIVSRVREYAWRRIRYEHLTWAEVTVAMPGRASTRCARSVLGVVAYGLFVHGELDAAIEAGEHAVAEAAACTR